MSTKQLYEKTSKDMKEISPLVAIEDIYSKLSDTPLEALISLYNHVKCEWKGSVADTRRTVPLFLRRSGLFITYNNGTKYITEFFSAGTDQITTEGWVKDSNWTSVPNEDYISAGVKPGVRTIGYEQLNDNLKHLFREKVNVTNFPDDEDITSVDNMLKLKDREVDAANFQSKGYVILRKNLRLVNGVVKNILTQDMINQPNTIYEIRYDFDLNGQTINVPENCTLKFEGGSLNNGSINGNNTIIKADLIYIFKNIITNGTYKINKSYPEWFGATYTNDDTNAIQKAFNLKSGEVYFSCGDYKISKTITSNYSNMTCNGGVTITAISEIDYMFIFDFSDTAYSIEDLEKHKYCIGINAKLNCNNLAKSAIGVLHCQYFDLSGFKIFNATRYALVGQYYDYNTESSEYKSGNVFFHFIYIINTIVNKNRVAILANRPDSIYSDITPVNFYNFIEVLAGAKFNNIHAWSYLTDIIEGSSLFLVNTYEYNIYNCCEADTIQFYFNYSISSTISSVISPKHYTNNNIYNGKLYFCKYNSTAGHKNNIIGGYLVDTRIIYEENKQAELIYNNVIDIQGRLSNNSAICPTTIKLSGYYNEIGINGNLAIIDNNLAFKNNGKWVYAKTNDIDVKSYGDYNTKPNNIKTGYIYIDTTTNRLIFNKNGKWFTCDGYSAENSYEGTSTPTDNTKSGMKFFNTDKEFWYFLRNSNGWNKVLTISNLINTWVTFNSIKKDQPLYNEYNYAYAVDKHKIVFYLNGQFIDSNGFNGEYRNIGNTTDRPQLTENDKGFYYFDTTINKPIWWTGTKWVDATGAYV